jgi:hypothetical protein
MPWLANRAQIIQVICAVVAVLVALTVWLAVPPQNLLYVAPIAFLICLVWAVWTVAEWYTSYHLQLQLQNLKLMADAPGTSATSKEIFLVNVRCAVGGFWEGRFANRDYCIVVHSIERISGKNNYRADVEITRGAESLRGGVNTEYISQTRYWINRLSGPFNTDASSVINIDTHPLEVRIAALRVDHINPITNEVKLILCVIYGFPTVV